MMSHEAKQWEIMLNDSWWWWMTGHDIWWWLVMVEGQMFDGEWWLVVSMMNLKIVVHNGQWQTSMICEHWIKMLMVNDGSCQTSCLARVHNARVWKFKVRHWHVWLVAGLIKHVRDIWLLYNVGPLSPVMKLVCKLGTLGTELDKKRTTNLLGARLCPLDSRLVVLATRGGRWSQQVLSFSVRPTSYGRAFDSHSLVGAIFCVEIYNLFTWVVC